MRWLQSALLQIVTAQCADHDSNEPQKWLLFERSEYMEDWMSGLNQQFTKLSAAKVAREFESHIFRNSEKLGFSGKFLK